jgi:hypothetical protein
MIKIFCMIGFAMSLCLAIRFTACAETVSLGAEVDMLPYLSGGYYLGGVVGFNHLNVRLGTTQTAVPGFVTPKGFENWDLDVNTIIVDYFPAENREGFWLAGGVEFWNDRIAAKDTGATANFTQKILTFGCGYTYFLNEHWYINPWAALHYNLSNDHVAVGSSDLKVPDLMYEASLKLGYRL